jgi:hypothetical protein
MLRIFQILVYIYTNTLEKGTYRMKKRLGRSILLLMLISCTSLANSRTNEIILKGYIVDKLCSVKLLKDKDSAKAAREHKECVKRCARHGLGIISEGKYYPLDTSGSKKALKLLESSTKKESSQVEVVGTLKKSGIVVVKSIKEIE